MLGSTAVNAPGNLGPQFQADRQLLKKGGSKVSALQDRDQNLTVNFIIQTGKPTAARPSRTQLVHVCLRKGNSRNLMWNQWQSSQVYPQGSLTQFQEEEWAALPHGDRM